MTYQVTAIATVKSGLPVTAARLPGGYSLRKARSDGRSNEKANLLRIRKRRIVLQRKFAGASDHKKKALTVDQPCATVA